MPADLLTLGSDTELNFTRTETTTVSYLTTPDDILRKFGNISKELEFLSGRKQREEAKVKFEKGSEEKAAQGADDQSDQQGKQQAVGTGVELEIAPEKKAPPGVGGLSGEPIISGVGLSEMEERFLQSCDPKDLTTNFIALAGEETESALLTGYQKILAYFRHKSMLADLGDHFARMRHAAMMGEEGAIHELAQANNGGTAKDASAGSKSAGGGKRRPKSKTAPHNRLPEAPARDGHSSTSAGHAEQNMSIDSPAKFRSDLPSRKLSEAGQAKLPQLPQLPPLTARKHPDKKEGEQRISVLSTASVANQRLSKAGFGHLIRRNQLHHSEGTQRGSLAKSRTSVGATSSDQAPEAQGGDPPPAPQASQEQAPPIPDGRRRSSMMSVVTELEEES